ncbi:hypothetical protein [Cohnella nanjingensis]|uniref:Uncharacterized protein n=1 Tax=Cohnella nanjingensis TaxID=1387779 RepID=A0A7X0VGQ8_9BACL|nr:hypothetical protein [Cohnella nanjingensis]MBB6672638.1 hypothetical protein [Cohnella nanjingensis]
MKGVESSIKMEVGIFILTGKVADEDPLFQLYVDSFGERFARSLVIPMEVPQTE